MYLIIDFIRHAQSESNMYKLEYNYIKKTMIVDPKVTPIGYKQINNVRNIKSSKGKFIKRYETYDMLCCSDYARAIQTAYHLFRDMNKKLHIIPYVKEFDVSSYTFFRKYDKDIVKELNNSNYKLKISTEIIDGYNDFLYPNLSKFLDFLLATLLNNESKYSLINSETNTNDNFRIAIVSHGNYINNFIKYFPNYNTLFMKRPQYGSMTHNIYNLTIIKCCVSKKELYRTNTGNYNFETPLLHVLSLKKKKYITKENKINKRNNLILITGIFIGISSLIYKLMGTKKDNTK